MSDGELNADLIIELIDADRLHPRSQVVARNLADHIRSLSEDDRQLIEAFDRRAVDSRFWLQRLWNTIDSLTDGDDSGLRILVGLARPDEAVDWYHAEFLIYWARQEGVSEKDILAAFGVVTMPAGQQASTR